MTRPLVALTVLSVPLLVGLTAAHAGPADRPSWPDGTDTSLVALGVGVAVLTFAALTLGRRRGVVPVMRDLASWVLLMVAVTAGYRYREDLLSLGARVAAEIAPASGLAHYDTQSEGPHSVRIRRRPDGHFIARTSLNGLTLTMLVDTGASMVVLRPVDAQKMGFNLAKLHFNIPVQTANGTTFAAPVTLRNVAVGPIKFKEVEALVAKPGALRDSLLGMSFLNRLRSYEFSGDLLTLRI